MKDRARAAALVLATGIGALAVLANTAPLRHPPDYTQRITADMLTQEHDRPVMLLIGDGFAAASPDTPAGHTFPWRTCAVMQWVCNVDAQAGSGYRAGGQTAAQTAVPAGGGARSYGQRVGEVRKRYLADVVVVTGGLDDQGLAPGTEDDGEGDDGDDDAARAGEYRAARQLFRTLAAAYPRAEHVAVEPFAVQDRPPADVVRLRAAVRRAATEEGFRWVDTDGWLTSGRLSAGGSGLNQAGHQAVGAKLARALQSLGVAADAGATGPAAATTDPGAAATRPGAGP